MNVKIYVNVAWLVFLFVAGVHLARLALGFPVMVNGWEVPFSVSGAALLVAGYMAYQGFRISRRN